MVKVIRKHVKPPVEKVVVELTPDQAKIIYAVFGSFTGDPNGGLRIASDSVCELFNTIFRDIPKYPFVISPVLKSIEVDCLGLEFKD